MDVSMYTCITCRVAFPDADLQRAHYKTDWHRYNLKRKVADMPPVTAENFQKRVLAQRAQVEEQSQDTSGHCKICNKHFGTKNALENHIKSKKHKEAEAKQTQRVQDEIERMNEKNIEKGEEDSTMAEKNAQNEAIRAATSSGPSGTKPKASTSRQSKVQEDVDMDSDEESVESWDGDALGEEECLFCSHISDALENNVRHMTSAHSFFIPDVEYLVDLPGLIGYLGQKVGEGHVCLWCNEKGKLFTSTKSVQKHMLDKGHCKLLHEGEVVFEYADFYDYRSSYPDYQAQQGQGDQDDPMEGAVGGRGGSGEGGAGEGGEEEEAVQQRVLDEANYQLVLPSGTMVGHRSLQRYYRQKLKPTRVLTLHKSSLPSVLSHYRALGWTGTTGAAAEKRAKDVAFVQRVRSRHHLKMGMKHNNQKYYRDPTL